MFRLAKLLVLLALVAGFVWFGRTVKLGNYTFFGHVQRIWHAEETQDLVEGTRRTARPTVERVKRGVEKGYQEAVRESESGRPAREAGE